MTNRLPAILAACFVAALAAVAAPPPATYRIRVVRTAPPAFHVTASVPASDRLAMETTRPGDVQEILERGWPALVSSLRAYDAQGRTLAVGPADAQGWRLPAGLMGMLTVEYDVDTALLAKHGYPAPREAAYASEDALSLVGRSLFVTTPGVEASTVAFDAPAGWKVVAPWPRVAGRGRQEFRVASRERLVDNLFVLTRSDPDVAEAKGFRAAAVGFGWWRPARREIRRVLNGHLRHFAREMGFEGEEAYVVVLLPEKDSGGESFRQSFALTAEESPSSANRADWGTRVGHELFHYWNGWLLAGGDYESSQWMQEGFTEYAADVSMVASGLAGEEWLRGKLAQHIGNYSRLTTSLERYGTTKGPPLYSGGTLAAFSCDVMIRNATGGRKTLADYFRALERRTGRGARPYETEDILASLGEAASLDWNAFFQAHVRGTEKLPLSGVFRTAGLRITEGPNGAVTVERDPAATAASRGLWEALVRER